MHHLDGEFYIYLVLGMAALVLVSIIIPFYGFFRKRWKGLALGCLIQPIVLVSAFLLVGGGLYLYMDYIEDTYRSEAMVSVHKAVVQDSDTISNTWYLKPDEECFHEYRGKEIDEDGDTTTNLTTHYYDVVRLDSTSVGVEDRLVVHFDFSSRTVTATDEDDTVEVISVNWDKVKTYFNR